MSDTITITCDEYDRLRAAEEHLADIAAYDAAKAALASGDDELVPHEYAVRLIDGENPITVFRDLRGMSKAGLARAAGVDRVQLHNIETGTRRGSVDTLAKLADALGVKVDDLI